jgi:uncharacterized protein (DUF433 family)
LASELDVDWTDIIATDPNVMRGKPVIAGTRLTVEFIIGLFASGWSEESIVRHYDVTHEQIQACLAYAHEILSEVHEYPLTRFSAADEAAR